MKVITNNVPRDTIDAAELTPRERSEFDYLNWSAIDKGDDGRLFFRYRGTLYDLGEFSAGYGITKGTVLPDYLRNWDGYLSESFFSAIVVRFMDDNGERVVVGTVLS